MIRQGMQYRKLSIYMEVHELEITTCHTVSAPMKSMQVTANMQAAAGKKEQTPNVQGAQPAYQVDISSEGESAQVTARIQKMLHNIASQTKDVFVNWTSEQKAAFNQAVDASNKKFAGQTTTENEGALVVCDLKDPADFFQGEGALWLDITAERSLEKTGLVNPLHEKSQAVMDKYFTAAAAVEKGGTDTFKRLNLEFAGVAFSANEKSNAANAAQEIAKGKYTWDEYNQAHSYAAELQNKAGVYVQAQAGGDEGSLSYSYNGTIVNVGIKQLDFMASHKEAETVWTKAMQGAYKNNRELTDALKTSGFDEAAKGYEKLLSNDVGGQPQALDNIMQTEFSQESGKLWSAAVGADKFKELQAKYSGNQHFTYSASILDKAYRDGQKEADIIHGAAADREPRNWYVTADGQVEETDGQVEDTDGINSQIGPLRQELKDLRKQLESLKSSNMADDQKASMTKNIKNRMQTIQQEINSLMENATKK